MSRLYRRVAAVVVPAAVVLSLPAVVSNLALDDWPQWRGPNRDGRSVEKGLLKDWPAAGPPLAWRASGAGEGYSSFAVAGGRLYTLGARAGTEYTFAFDVASGKKLWEAANGSASTTTEAAVRGVRQRSTATGFTRSAPAVICRRSRRPPGKFCGRSTCSASSVGRTSSGG